jgi:hypothetical protein
LVTLFRVDFVVSEDGAIEADDCCVAVVDQDDDLGSGMGSAEYSDLPVQCPV